MPFLFRSTFFFKDATGHGWSETIHSNQTDLTNFLNTAVALGSARRDLLGTGAKLVFCRVSDDLVKRDSRIFIFGPGDQATRIGAQTASDIANTSLVVRMDTSDPRFRRTLYMRGIPDSIVTNSGSFTPDGNWLNAFAAWAALLEINGWSLRSRDQTQPAFPIVSVAQDPATGIVTVVTTGGPAFALNLPLQIQGCRGCPQLNGAWIPFQAVDANTVRIKLTQILPAYAGNGTARKLVYTLLPFIDIAVLRVSHRIAGRPFDSPVGRRRVRLRR